MQNREVTVQPRNGERFVARLVETRLNERREEEVLIRYMGINEEIVQAWIPGRQIVPPNK